MTKKKQILILIFIIIIAIVSMAFIGLVFNLNKRINNSLKTGWFKPPTEYYTAAEKLNQNDLLSPSLLQKKLKQRYYIQHKGSHPLLAGYFLFQKNQSCKNTNTQHCLEWKDTDTNVLVRIGFLNNKITFLQQDNKKVDFIFLKPFLFAQYEGDQPVLKKTASLKEVPFYCLQAVLSAEDNTFIVHDGIHIKSILRAAWKNLLARTFIEGGSTITQQLVKNIFFTNKKTLSRKFQEQIMAIILEQKISKDAILIAYLNIVYMGQAGVFRIHGFSSAAEHYIGKPLSKINLSECALLASLLKSPGQYKPSVKNKKTLIRRNYILNTLYKKNIINQQELQKAKSKPIIFKIKKHTIPAYFTDVVYKKLSLLNLPLHKGVKIFTTLNLDYQKKATLSISQGLKKLNKPNLQAALISVDISTGAVHSLVGGAHFKISQFNRVVQAYRQIGSLIKPVVVVSALIQNPKLNALSIIEDKKFNYKYDISSWSPKNYKDIYKGFVPIYKILTLSLNTAAAKLGLKTGLKPFVKVLKKLGYKKKLVEHPSLLLGALEMSPWEVSQIFLTLANMGIYKKQHIIQKVTNLEGQIIYKNQEPHKQVLDPKKVAVLIGMLKEVTQSGTAKSLSKLPIFIAGKTGTTNKERDAWFMGFTPDILTIIWLGFDNNQSTYLTGASGALPLWKSFIKKILPSISTKDFNWPDGVKSRVILEPQKDSKKNHKISLIFEK